MLWFAKQAKSKSAGDGQTIEPATLEVRFDVDIAKSKLDTLLGDCEERGGVQSVADALRLKHELFAAALPAEGPAELDREGLDTLISCVFPARRKLPGILGAMDTALLSEAVNGLVYGTQTIEQRMAAFCELIPKEQKKPRRAMWDLACELLHFRDPERIPLMARWVWDTQTGTGALREFIRANDGMETVPLDTRPESFEGARAWFSEVLAESGFYRDIPFLIDLLQAQAYSEYVKAMSSRIGMIDAEFGTRHDPLELPLKILGIDARAKDVKALRSDEGPALH